MTAIAEFTLPAADFPLGRVFEEHPDATLELDRVVPTGDTVMPFFWVTDPDGDLAAIRDLFDDLPELRSATLMEIVGDRGLFNAEWDPEYMGIMAAVGATDVTVLSATGSIDGWVFELRAASMDQFAEFRRYCDDHDIPVDLTRLSRLSEMSPGDEYDLTPEQREALVLAYREGYYDDVGRPDQDALAAQFGISRQALSARLRRGYRNLIESTLVREHRDDEQ